jgi:hypothetical protein
MSHQEEKNQAAKAKARQNELANKGQNQQGKQPGQPTNRPQTSASELDSSSQLHWSETERNERNERGERNERNERNNER